MNPGAWLNYHHLLYFWTVARAGTLARASQELFLSQGTISTQLKQLDAAVGHPLFVKQGRRLVLTDVGRTVYRYADEIFRLGNELKGVLAGGELTNAVTLEVGVAQALPKIVAERLLRPALKAAEQVRLICREGPVQRLVGELAVHALDVVIAEAPAGENASVRTFNHLLGRSGITFFAAARHAGLKKKFPESLHQAPMLVSSEESAVRTAIDRWLAKRQLAPRVMGEFDDSALLEAFGRAGLGVFALPTAVEEEICRQFEVVPIGRTDEIEAAFYAISVERRLRHPAVVAIAESARTDLFG